MSDEQAAQLSINTIRTLSIDAVQQAKSGHPGTPMALAPLVYTIWNRVMNFDPQDPIWPNRDRFVLSNGHASMLLWSILHLTQVQAVNAEYERLGQPSVTLDDIRRFRQIGSKAPGHPEYHWVSGVETTTGPLGQGAATSVGTAGRRAIGLPGLGGGTSAMTGTGGAGTGIPATTVSLGGSGAVGIIGGAAARSGGGRGAHGTSGSGTARTSGIWSVDSRGCGSGGSPRLR